MADNTLKEKIIRKILAAKKLVAQGSGGEAENAASAVAKLMARHAITEADLQGSEPRNEAKMVRYPVKCPGVAWQRRLMFAVAEFCSVFAAYSKSHMYLYGEEQDCVYAEYIIGVAQDQIAAKWREYSAEYKAEFLMECGYEPDRSQMFDVGKSYRDSAVTGFHAHLRTVTAQEAAAADVDSGRSVGSTALVLTTRREVATSWARDKYKFSKGKSIRRYNHSARGYSDGNAIRVNRGLSDAAPKKRIGGGSSH